MINEIKTIRESLDEYKRRLSERGFDKNSNIDQRYYPYDNISLAMKASSESIKEMFEDYGQLGFLREIRGRYCYDCLSTGAFIQLIRADKGGNDPTAFCERYTLDQSWTPMIIHPNQAETVESDNTGGRYVCAIKTLELLLSVAEKNRVPMITEHIDGEWGTSLVSYTA